MATVRLDERRARSLKPRNSAFDIRDRELKRFGIRVLLSGAMRYFIHSQHQGRRVWKIVGRDGAIGPDEARKRARTLLTSIRNARSMVLPRAIPADGAASASIDSPFPTGKAKRLPVRRESV